MKYLFLLLTLTLSIIGFSQSKPNTRQADPFAIRVVKENDIVSVLWQSQCDEIRIIGPSDQFFPTFECLEVKELHLHNLIEGEYIINFYYKNKWLNLTRIKV